MESSGGAVRACDPIAPLRDAATVVLLRDAPGVPEVLLLRRHARSGFAAGAWVFPGGVVDPGDRCLDPALWTGLDVDAAAAVTGRPPDIALGLHVAAVRETFEEAGLLLARRPDGTAPPAPERTLDLLRWLAAAGAVLDLGLLRPYSRWRTPDQEPRRYDTVFFLARAPQGQVAASDRVETTEARWLTPGAALEAHARGELPLIYPTVVTLEELAGLGDLDAILSAVPRGTRLRPLQPHVVLDAEGRVTGFLHPDDPAYPWERYPELRS
jgi:8-oxo-dGTP pyrophosphatase MutT (NUDIX family)